MPKSQVICPEQVRRSGYVEFQPIPVNQYNKTVADELASFSKKDLLRIQRDMEIIRAFENAGAVAAVVVIVRPRRLLQGLTLGLSAAVAVQRASALLRTSA